MTCKLHIVGSNPRLLRTQVRCDCGWEELVRTGHEWNSWTLHVLFDTDDVAALDAAVLSGEVTRAAY